MAKDKEGQEVDEEEDNKPNEAIFGKEERDPDEAVIAEQAIHHYANDVLAAFQDQTEMAMSSVEAFLMSQTEQDAFNGRFFLEDLGRTFMESALQLFGGADSPIAQAVFPMLDGAIDESSRECNAGQFIKDLKTALRDCSWHLRDNLESVLSNQWDELRDLAYEGSTDFIPALHAYGLPQVDFDKNELSQPLIDQTSEYVKAMPQEKEEEMDQSQVAQFEEEEKKMEDPEKNMALEEEEKKEATI